jgi:hypothetical protein
MILCRLQVEWTKGWRILLSQKSHENFLSMANLLADNFDEFGAGKSNFCWPKLNSINYLWNYDQTLKLGHNLEKFYFRSTILIEH